LLEVGETRVEAVDGDPGGDRFLDGGDERVRGDERGGDAVNLGVDRFWISTACLVASGSEEYFRVEPVSLAAWLAPDLMRSQKVSPGVSWVIIAKV